jgi:hypothetical protein
VPPDAGEESGALDASVDAPPPIQVPVSRAWTTINGALFTTNGEGTVITGFTDPFTHPILVPSPSPIVPAPDFTVTATIYAPHECEFGLLTRMVGANTAVGLGAEFAQQSIPFLGKFAAASNYNPTPGPEGAAYTFVVGSRYVIKLTAAGTSVRGKLWKLPDPEPTSWLGPIEADSSTATGIGFYVYPIGQYDARIEDVEITVP